MLQHPGPGNGARFGNMAHQENGAACGFGRLHQKGGTFPHLRYAARRRADIVSVHRLDGIYHHKIGLKPLNLLQHVIQIGLCLQIEPV